MVKQNKTIVMKYIGTILFLTVVLAGSKTFAQEEEGDKLNQNVVVVKEFEPTVSDAFKISDLPRIIDTTSVNASFNYMIRSQQLNTDFSLEDIKPARMVGEPLNRLYRGYVKAGFGNYMMPLGEVNVSNLRSKELLIGFNARHLSSSGEIKNNAGVKVPSGFSDDMARVYAKRFYRNATAYGGIRFDRNLYHYYGYNTEILDTTLERDDIQNYYYGIGAVAGYKTNYTDSTHLNYDIKTNYLFFRDFSEYMENHGGLGTSMSYFYKKEELGGNLHFDYYNKSLLDTSYNLIAKFEPWIKVGGAKWKIKAGLNMHTDVQTEATLFHWYPNIDMQYDVYENMVIPYAGAYGFLETNNYRKIMLENPFVSPGYRMANTNHKMHVFAGFKGKVSQNLSYDLRGEFQQVDSMYFFVIDTNLELQNQFNVVYDYAEIYKFSGQVGYKRSDKLQFLLRGSYFVYNLLNEDYAWNKPEYTVSLTGRYNLQNKIFVDADILLFGKRYVQGYNSSSYVRELAPYVDINLGVEYRYNKLLSAFVNFNNIAASKYKMWNNYPVQRFNVMVGVTYSLWGEKAGD